MTAVGAQAAVDLTGYIQAQGARIDNDVELNQFTIPRARLGATMEISLDVSATIEMDLGEGDAELTDAYISLKNIQPVTIVVGQFKVPYSAEVMAADDELDLIERANISELLRPDGGRDIGLAVIIPLLEDQYSIALGAFNGNGANRVSNDNDEFLFAARIGGNVVATETMSVDAGLNATLDTSTDAGVETDATIYGLDVAMAMGQLMVKAEYHTETLEPAGAADIDIDGYFGRVGYMVTDNVQVLAEYGTVDLAGTDINNISAGPGESFMDHNGKGSVTGSNNWIRKGTKGVPDTFENTIYGDDPGFVNFDQRNLCPKADSPLLKAGQEVETSMPYVKLVTEFHKGEVDGVSPSPIYLSAVNEIESSTLLFSPARKGYSSKGSAAGTGIDIGAYTYPEKVVPKGGQESK